MKTKIEEKDKQGDCRPQVVKNKKNFIRLIDNSENQEDITENHFILEWLRKIGTQIAANLNWRLNGGKTDWDEERKKRDWTMAVHQMEGLLEGKNIKDITPILEKFVEMQAKLFYMFRKQRGENNFKTEKDDFHDAKRFIGFLISEKLIERCVKKRNKYPEECFRYLRKEFIGYLITLSVEEFIRIKSYFLWGKENGWEPFDNRMDADKAYFLVQDVLEYSQRNCRNENPDQIFQNIPDDTKDYIKNKKIIDIERIINAKIFANQRLNIHHPQKIENYMKILYPQLKIAMQGQFLKKDIAENLLELYYQSNNIPNMLEYFLRCYICSNLKTKQHESIRKKHCRPLWTPDFENKIKRVFL